MKRRNTLRLTDAYKETHWLQDPKGTQKKYSYMESRGGFFDSTVFFGLQYSLKEYLSGQIVQPWMLNEAKERSIEVFGTDKYFNEKGYKHILNKCKGRWPVRICAVPEGMRVPVNNVLFTVENTDPAVPFATNFIEDILMQTWYPTTVCTLSWHIKKLIKKYADQTGCEVSPFHLNDFGLRGASSMETASIGGAAHLVNFLGTDTLPAIDFLKEYYHAKTVGHSVLASEHSTTTIYGKDKERDAFERFITAAPDEAIVSIVIDSYDTLNAVSDIIGTQLKDLILKRKGKVVVRPDSGTPEQVSVEVLNALWQKFGGTTNTKGFKVLDPHVGMIYGDGINYQSIDLILAEVVKAGFCVSNIVFGMGGALLQQVNRDTQKFAIKCSWAQVEGQGREVFKQPKTDSGKNSKRGRLKLVMTNFGTVMTTAEDQPGQDLLVPVFENGEILRSYTLDEIRTLAAKQ